MYSKVNTVIAHYIHCIFTSGFIALNLHPRHQDYILTTKYNLQNFSPGSVLHGLGHVGDELADRVARGLVVGDHENLPFLARGHPYPQIRSALPHQLAEVQSPLPDPFHSEVVLVDLVVPRADRLLDDLDRRQLRLLVHAAVDVLAVGVVVAGSHLSLFRTNVGPLLREQAQLQREFRLCCRYRQYLLPWRVSGLGLHASI
jgi:hypothetical protein